MKEDYSKVIYNKFYSTDLKILQVLLKNGSIMEGVLVGFYQGDSLAGEPFITRWNFVVESDFKEYDSLPFYARKNDLEKIIKQEEIELVQFKNPQ